MRIFLPCLLLSICFLSQSFAQNLRNTVSFQLSNDFGVPNQDILTVARTSSPNYILGGYSNSPNGDNKGGWDYWMVNAQTQNGYWYWLGQDFGGSGDDYLTDLISTSDKGYLLAGYSNSNASGDKSQDNQGQTDYWIVRTDSNGNKLWDKDFGGSCYDYLYSVQQTADSGFVLAGFTCSPAGGDITDSLKVLQNFWLVKTDAYGNKQWDHTYGSNGVDYCTHVEVVKDGYVLFGYTNGTGGDVTQPSQGGYDYWIIKVDLTGKKMWDKRFGSADDDLGNYFTKTPDGGFLLGGTSAGSMGGDKSQNSFGGKDYWVIRIDSNGNKLWDKVYGGPQDDILSGNITLTSDNGFLLAGASASDSGTYKQENNLGSMQSWMVKIDSNGNYQWDRTFLTDGHDQFGFAQEMNDTTYLLANYSNSPKTIECPGSLNNSDDYMAALFHKWTKPVFRWVGISDSTLLCTGGIDTFKFAANTTILNWSIWAVSQQGNQIIVEVNNDFIFKFDGVPFLGNLSSGSYSLMWVISNPIGSDTIIQPNALTIYPPPVCYGFYLQNDTLFADSIKPGLIYQWNYSYSIPISGATNSYYVPKNSGTYTLCTETKSGCRCCISQFVTLPGASIVLNGSDAPIYICSDSCITFSLSASPQPDSIDWLFQEIDAPGGYIKFLSQQHPKVCYPYNNLGPPYPFDVTVYLHYGPFIDTVVFGGIVNVYPLLVGNSTVFYSYDGDTLDLLVDGTGLVYQSGYHIQWYFNNQMLSGDTFDVVKPAAPGSYEVYVMNQWGCHAFWSPFTLSAPLANFNSNIAVACDSANIRFYDLSVGYPIGWRWYFPGGVPDTSTIENPYNIHYATPGAYDVKLLTVTNIGNDSIIYPSFIKIYATPSANVNRHVDTLMVIDTASSYQWYYNGKTIIGATGRQYIAEKSGDYYAVVSNGGCTDTSAVFSILNTGENQLVPFNKELIISPNPSSGLFQLSGFNAPVQRIEVYNLLGERILLQNNPPYAATTTNPRLYIDLTTLSGSTYLVRVYNNDGSVQAGKLIVN